MRPRFAAAVLAIALPAAPVAAQRFPDEAPRMTAGPTAAVGVLVFRKHRPVVGEDLRISTGLGYRAQRGALFVEPEVQAMLPVIGHYGDCTGGGCSDEAEEGYEVPRLWGRVSVGARKPFGDWAGLAVSGFAGQVGTADFWPQLGMRAQVEGGRAALSLALVADHRDAGPDAARWESSGEVALAYWLRPRRRRDLERPMPPPDAGIIPPEPERPKKKEQPEPAEPQSGRQTTPSR